MTEIAVINVQLAPPREPRNQWERERAAFLDLLPTLLPDYCGRYVAIHDGAVAAVADDPVAAAMETYATHGYVPIHVGLVTDQPQPRIRIPSPRLPENMARA
jgi:hypothetical protein